METMVRIRKLKLKKICIVDYGFFKESLNGIRVIGFHKLVKKKKNPG